MLSAIHNRFSTATETKYGVIPPTFPFIAEDKAKDDKQKTEIAENIVYEIVDKVVENITQCELPEPAESKETEDEVVEKYPIVSNNPLFVEPPDFILEDVYANYDDDNFEEQKPAKKKRGVLKTFLNEFKPTYRKKPKKNKSIL